MVLRFQVISECASFKGFRESSISFHGFGRPVLEVSMPRMMQTSWCPNPP